MLDAVLKEADKKVAEQVGLVSVTNPTAMKEAYNLKAEEIMELLEQGLLPEIKDFLEEEEGLTSSQKMQWLMDLSGAFDGTKKNVSLKMSHSMSRSENVLVEIQRSKEFEMGEKEGVKD